MCNFRQTQVLFPVNFMIHRMMWVSCFYWSGNQTHQQKSHQRLLTSRFIFTVQTRSGDNFIERLWKPAQWVMCLPLHEMSFYSEASIRPWSGPCSPVWLSQTWLLMRASSSLHFEKFSKWRWAYSLGRLGTSWRLHQFFHLLVFSTTEPLKPTNIL